MKNKYLEQQVEKSSMLQSMCREVGNEHQLLLDPDSSVPGINIKNSFIQRIELRPCLLVVVVLAIVNNKKSRMILVNKLVIQNCMYYCIDISVLCLFVLCILFVGREGKRI